LWRVSLARNRVISSVRRVNLIRNWFKKSVFQVGGSCHFFGFSVALVVEDSRLAKVLVSKIAAIGSLRQWAIENQGGRQRLWQSASGVRSGR